MKLTYRYKLRPTKEQNVTMIKWLNLCRRQYNYRLGQRIKWWEETRTPVNSCPLNVSIVPVDRIYHDIPEFRCPTKENSIAIDVGLERFLTCDDGTYVEIPRFFRQAAERLARLQQAKSKLPNGHKDKPIF